MSANQPATSKKRIFLVDDHAVMREGLARLIEDDPNLEVSAQFDSANRLLPSIDEFKPDLVIIDICLEDTHGLELIKDLRAQYAELPLLALSMYDEALYAERAVRAGANGYVMKRSSPETVVEAIHAVLRGELWLGPSVRDRMVDKFLGRKSADASNLDGLSDREFEVFQFIGQGLKTKQIAEKLSISPKTVDTYRAHLKEKLNLQTGADLVRYAVHWTECQGSSNQEG